MKSPNVAVKKLRATLSSVILSLMLCALTTSCTHYVIVESNHAPIMLRAGQKLTAPHDGVYVPDALWLEMNEALEDCRSK